MDENSRKVIYSGKSELETYEVVEEIYTSRPSRVLYSGKIKTAQSGIPLDKVDLMLFEYMQRLYELVIELNPGSILMIGGGAYTFVTYLLNKCPQINIDVVEPDNILEDIAHKYFGLKMSARLKIYNDYGQHYLKNNKKHYDLIIIDAYKEETIPKEIVSKRFAKVLSRSLKPGGIVAMNIISSLRLDDVFYAVHEKFSRYFKYTKLYPVSSNRLYFYPHNLIYTLSPRPINESLKYPELKLPAL